MVITIEQTTKEVSQLGLQPGEARPERKPYFSKKYTTTSNIAASGTSNENFISEGDQFAAAPFDTIVITNMDDVHLGIRLDGNPDNLITIPAGAIIAADNQEFRFFTVENLDAATAHTAGKIKILVQNTEFPVRS